jgi:hypothetical protein
MAPAVVICMTNTRPSASGKPLLAVFKTYHEAPVNVLLSKAVAPGVRKNGDIGWLASSTKDGSAAPGTLDAGPSNPIVA